MSRACLTSRVPTMRSGSIVARGPARTARCTVVAAAQRPSVNGAGIAASSIAAIALMLGAPVGPALAERTPKNTPMAYEDLPKDGPKVNEPGQLQPGDGIDLPRSNAKAMIDAQDMAQGKQPAGQPRRISALPAAPSLFEVANLGDSVKEAIGFNRELGDTDSAGTGAGNRLQNSAKEAFSSGADQAKDALQSSDASRAIDSARGAAQDLANKAKSNLSALPAAPMYEVADLGSSVKDAIGFNRELGNTDNAGSGAAARLKNSAQEAFSGDQIADEAASKLQSTASNVQPNAKEAVGAATGVVKQLQQ